MLCILLHILAINLINRKYGPVILSDRLLVLTGIVPILVLPYIWQTGGNELFKIDAMISIFLGFLALLITFFFVNQERTRKIKEHHMYKLKLIFMLREMYFLLERVKENLRKIPEEKTGYSVEVIKESIKEIHFLEYLSMKNQLSAYNMYTHLDDEDSNLDWKLVPMGNFFAAYITENKLTQHDHMRFYMGIRDFREILDLDKFQSNKRIIFLRNSIHKLLGELVDTKALDAYEDEVTR